MANQEDLTVSTELGPPGLFGLESSASGAFGSGSHVFPLTTNLYSCRPGIRVMVVRHCPLPESRMGLWWMDQLLKSPATATVSGGGCVASGVNTNLHETVLRIIGTGPIMATGAAASTGIQHNHTVHNVTIAVVKRRGVIGRKGIQIGLSACKVSLNRLVALCM